MAGEEKCSLALLPGELVSLVCQRLDTRSVARLEQCSVSLRGVIQVYSPGLLLLLLLLLLQECGV
mgnify:CR=1 FL=1